MSQACLESGIELEYETFGHSSHPALLLVNGLSSQMIDWDVKMCRRFADAGRNVIRFDNRDCGLSTKFDGVEVDQTLVIAALSTNDPSTLAGQVPYTLNDMADDAFGLLDHLGIQVAHIVGRSMGGMIVQAMAIDRPDRVLSVTSIMSMTGEPEYGQSQPSALAALLEESESDRAAYVEQGVRNWSTWYSKRYRNDDGTRANAAESFDRSFYPEGGPRQFAAIVAAGSRAQGLKALAVPMLVIHGEEDTLIDLSGGRRTFELVPGSVMLMLKDMSHDLPEPLWPVIVGAVLTHTGG